MENELNKEKEEQESPEAEQILKHTETELNSNRQPEQMEVHHHTHTARKKWSHLLFEFFMLFLAVFCGFLAEYQLEHRIEKDKEKQYITSLIRDIKTDTSNLQGITRFYVQQAKHIDTLLSILKNLDTVKRYNQVYSKFIHTAAYYIFTATDRTVQQLKNAGGLRMITDLQASDTITAYYEKVKAVYDQGNVFMRYFDEFHKEAFSFIDYSEIDTLFYRPHLVNKVHKDLEFISNDRAMVKRVYNKLFAYRFIIDSYLEVINELNQKGLNCLTFLRKEYRIAD